MLGTIMKVTPHKWGVFYYTNVTFTSMIINNFLIYVYLLIIILYCNMFGPIIKSNNIQVYIYIIQNIICRLIYAATLLKLFELFLSVYINSNFF